MTATLSGLRVRKLNEAEERFFVAMRLRAVHSMPYLASALFRLTPLSVDGLGTMATDDSWRCYIDFQQAASWGMEQAAAVYIHEVNHPLRGHHARAKAMGAQPDAWNVSCFPAGTFLPSGAPIEDHADMVTPFDGELAQVRTTAGAIEATPEHPFFVRRRRHRSYPIALLNPEWVEAAQVAVGDYLCVPVLKDKIDSDTIDLSGFIQRGLDRLGRRTLGNRAATSIPLDAGTAWLLGLYTAEGSASPAVRFSLGSHETDLAERALKIAESIGYSGSIQVAGTRMAVDLGAVVFGRWLKEHVGPRSQTKRIPAVILRHADPLIQRAFIEGLVAGDGSERRLGTDGYAQQVHDTSSLALHRDVVLLLAQLGLGCSTRASKQPPRRIRGRALPETDIYRVTFTPDGPRETERWMNGRAVRSTSHRWKVDEHGVWYPVTEVSSRRFTGPVYNLVNTPDHTYVANAYLVHNCDMEINDDLRQMGLPLPADGCYPEQLSDAQGNPAPEGQTAEFYYDLIPRGPGCPRCGPSDAGDSSDGSGDTSPSSDAGDQPGEGGGDGNADADDAAGDDSDGNAGGAGQDGDSDSDGSGGGGQDASGSGGGCSCVGDSGGVTAGQCGSGAGGRPSPVELPANDSRAPAVNPAQAELIRRKVAEDVREHARAKGRGSVPGGLERWSDEVLAPPQVPWQQVLRASLRQAINAAAGSVDYTYSRPSRRDGGSVIFPGMQRPKVTVGTVIDTSGSMSHDDLTAALSEVEGIVRKAGVRGRDHRLMTVDAAATKPVTVQSAKQVTLTGGGGTDMRVGIAAMEALKPRPQVIIVFTDGYTPWPDVKTPKSPKLVVALIGTADSTAHAEEAFPPPEWARVVHIDTDQAT